MALTGEAKKIWQRNYLRTRAYGNWRQIYVGCNGVCQGIVPIDGNCLAQDLVICGETENLEFHEIWDENGRRKEIRLLCIRCHDNAAEHRSNVTITCKSRHYPSKLQEDVDREIRECGSLEAWMGKYSIVDGAG